MFTTVYQQLWPSFVTKDFPVFYILQNDDARRDMYDILSMLQTDQLWFLPSAQEENISLKLVVLSVLLAFLGQTDGDQITSITSMFLYN